MFSSYHLMIADFYNIPIVNVKKLVPNFFDKKSALWELATLSKTKIRVKKK